MGAAVPEPRKIIVSIGGNAIVKRGGSGTIEEQFENLEYACRYIARMSAGGHSIIITHGNGPIVGNIVIRNESAKNIVPPMPLYICDADSEGGIGFMIQQTLYNQLHRFHNIKDVVTVVTQVVVDIGDPAFKKPSKPIGPYYTREEAEAIAKARGWVMSEDSSRGFRRTVPSPRPKRIIESAVIKRLSEEGVIVIAAGGGGVPVIEGADGTLTGVDAVIDKDYATCLLALETGADTLVNLTQVEMVYLDFGKDGERGIAGMSVKDARKHLSENQFAPGSMGPKIRSAVDFLEGGGTEVVITSPEAIEPALEGRAGTRIFK